MTGNSSSPPAPRTQAQRSESTRRLIIDTTITGIAEQGYAATTHRRICERAGVSLGALAHHFPTRLDLIAGTLDHVGRRAVAELRAPVLAASRSGTLDTVALLDVLWTGFHSQLSTVWIKVWLAAAEDPDLYARLAPCEDRFNAGIAELIGELEVMTHRPPHWRSSLGVAMHTLRGLALSLSLEPRAAPRRSDPWPTVRAELVALIDRP